MMKTRMLALALAVVGGSGTVAGRAHAGELDISLGLDAADSDWEEDHLSYGSFKLGYRFWQPWFQLSYVGKLGYASVDERLLTYLSLGPEVRPQLFDRLRPYARFTLVHQHEENVDAAQEQPFQAMLGVGDGIRHRAGVAGGLGLEIPFTQHRKGDWYVSIDLSATYFPDDRGPHRYLTGGASVGFNWDFDRTAPAKPAEVADARR